MKVCVNGTYSESRQLQVSVPQGSTSGANIFTAYCSLIDNVIQPNLVIN